MKNYTRKEFLKTFAVFFTFIGLGRLAAACSNNDDDTGGDTGGGGPTPQPDCLNAGTNVSFNFNHGHVLAVSKEDVAAGVSRTYDITGSSGHSHSVTVTGSDFATLAGNQQIVEVSTSGGGHTHTVTVSCKLA